MNEEEITIHNEKDTRRNESIVKKYRTWGMKKIEEERKNKE